MSYTRSIEPLLTILVPTRNRRKEILNLVESLFYHLSEKEKQLCEILISDNSDAPYNFNEFDLRSEALDIKVIRPNQVFLTAEENLFFGWNHARGTYIWVLGDDDPINFYAVSTLFQMISARKSKILFFNSNLISTNGQLLQRFRIPAKNDSFEIDLASFVARAGAWYASSGFSTWVIQRSLLNSEQALRWITNQNRPIYGHVLYFLKILHNEQVKFVNLPLVYYRMNTYDEKRDQENWWNYAKSSNRYFRQAWINDFPVQIENLVEEGLLLNHYLGTIIEQGHEGFRFPLTFLLADLALEQIEIALSDKGECIPTRDAERLLEIFRVYSPSIYPLLRQTFEINSILSNLRCNNSLVYRLKAKRFGADIRVARHNIWQARETNPFRDFVAEGIEGNSLKFIEKSVEVAELGYIDFGIGTNYYFPLNKHSSAIVITTNIWVLRIAQYLPAFLRTLLRNLYFTIRKAGKSN